MLFILVFVQFCWLLIQLLYLYSDHYIDRLDTIDIRRLYKLDDGPPHGPHTIPSTRLNWHNLTEHSYRTMHWWQNWADETALVDMPILGTHQSLTYTVNNVISLFTKTQKYSLIEQLNRGVRALDIRLKLNAETGLLSAFHDFVDLNLSWSKVWRTLDGWLESFPLEGLIVMIRDESYKNHSLIGRRAIEQMDETVRRRRVLLNTARFDLTDEKLTVGRLRGKIFLLNQSDGNVSLPWADNRDFTVGRVRISDRYDTQRASDKLKLCLRFYGSIYDDDDDDDNDRTTKKYLNVLFTSIVNRNPFSSIQNTAESLNRDFENCLRLVASPILGCVIMKDWIE